MTHMRLRADNLNQGEKQPSSLSSNDTGRTILVSIGFVACISIFQPAFFSYANVLSLLYYTALVTPAVLGMYVLILLGYFDLSVGATAALSGVLCAKAIDANIPLVACVAIAIISGALIGILNWFSVAKLGAPALLATLIGMAVARAFALGITDGHVIGGLPSTFGHIFIGYSHILVRNIALASLAVVAIEYLSRRHILFKRLYVVGSNRSAAKHFGIQTSHLDCMAFVASALGGALVGLLQSARTLSASPLEFQDLSLECIAACVIGGMRLSGGRGQAIGAVIGMFVVVTARNLVTMVGVSVYWTDLAVAIVLISAVVAHPKLERNTN